MPQSPQSGILQEVAVTTKECGRGGRLRPRFLDPLATARDLQVLKFLGFFSSWWGWWDWGTGMTAAVPFLLCFGARRN